MNYANKQCTKYKAVIFEEFSFSSKPHTAIVSNYRSLHPPLEAIDHPCVQGWKLTKLALGPSGVKVAVPWGPSESDGARFIHTIYNGVNIFWTS